MTPYSLCRRPCIYFMCLFILCVPVSLSGSIRIRSLSYAGDLTDPNSDLFKRYEQLICGSVSRSSYNIVKFRRAYRGLNGCM